LLQKILHLLLMPDVVSYNTAIMALQVRGADMVSYNAGIRVCRKGRQWERALGLLEEMLHQLLMPNVVT